VSLFTDHEEKSVHILVAGKNGSLGLKVHTEGPTLAVSKSGRYEAVAELLANGRLKGWFVDHKGATPRADTLVFFPGGRGGNRFRGPESEEITNYQRGATAPLFVTEGGVKDGRQGSAKGW